jgi:hypothetical protein
MEEPEQALSLGRKFAFFLLAWIATAILMFPVSLYNPVLFPIGLVPMVGASEEQVRHSWVLKVGWLLYAGLMAGACISRRKRTYFIIYAIFCLLLIVNIIGCRAMAGAIH